MALLPF